ncbi:MAG: ABC transporter permease [Planctomycetota bacterium]
MEYLIESLWQAVKLIGAFDEFVADAVFVSLRVSIFATILSCAIGVPVGLWLARTESPLKNILITLANTLHAFPTVVVGLIVYSFICRRGPLGNFDLLFSPTAIIIGEAILGLPIAISFSLSAVKSLDPAVTETALTLGASRAGCALIIISEARFGIVAAVVATFGRLLGEVGVAMILGGNIAGYTRNITTAIALETSKGEFSRAIALGFVLIVMALVVNIALRFLQAKKDVRQ